MNYKILRLIFWMCIVSFYCISIFSVGSFGNKVNVSSPSVIHVNNGLLTVMVKDMPIREVLDEITKQIPIKFVFFVSGEESLKANFLRLPVEKGLKQLLSNYNYTLVKGTGKSRSDGNEIMKVTILSRIWEKEEPGKVVLEEELFFELADKDMYDEELGILNENFIPNTLEEEIEIVTVLKEVPSIESLSKDLRDVDPIKREKAVISLLGLDGEVGVELLIDILHSDEDAEVRMIAAESLGSIGGEESVDALRSLLQDGDKMVRDSAMRALSLNGGARAIEALESALPGSDEAMKEFITEELELLKGNDAVISY